MSVMQKTPPGKGGMVASVVIGGVIGLVLIAVMFAVLAACAGNGGHDSAASSVTSSPGRYRAAIDETTPTVTAPKGWEGMYRVGVDIAAGTYRIAPTGGIRGYYELCADIRCDVGAGLIDNELVDGPSYLQITPDVAYVKLQRLVLLSDAGATISPESR